MVEGLHFEDPILGLDLSLACVGWAVLLDDDWEAGHVSFRGAIGEQLPIYRAWLKDMVRQWRPAIVVREAPIVTTGRQATENAFGLSVATKEALRTYTGIHQEVHQGTWKSQVCGNGRISTEQKKQGAVMVALNNLGFDVRHIDEADALAVALCKRKELFGKIRDYDKVHRLVKREREGV